MDNNNNDEDVCAICLSNENKFVNTACGCSTKYCVDCIKQIILCCVCNLSQEMLDKAEDGGINLDYLRMMKGDIDDTDIMDILR
ncbi:MAG: hypothetical protein Terrestrivirus1_342 [Terrestrivirus sp.]|uniref:RING-type domain-containing protein n=1 Tax=Terrestrivirus sp. TaxID=2487775 RepID=A0A3G4ZKV4_9VIRU|nr:MAG: hypothetical protein Terrestrivirus1_342 [Terrestrivirus sp.]